MTDMFYVINGKMGKYSVISLIHKHVENNFLSSMLYELC
jgi:hypothetical protein